MKGSARHPFRPEEVAALIDYVSDTLPALTAAEREALSELPRELAFELIGVHIAHKYCPVSEPEEARR